MIELRILGPIEVLVDGRTAPRELLWRKNLALLVYLARSPERRRSREHLIGVLWGDKPDPAARHSLNEALRMLRRAGGEDLLSSEGDQLVVSANLLSLDADHLETCLAAEDREEAARLVRGPCMEGFAVPDNSLFEDWLAAERVHWSDRMGEALRGHAEARLACGDVTGASEAAARALRLDPFSDSAVRLSMLATALRGERAAALAAYESYAGRLADGLGIEPDPDTEALAERIRREREWRLPPEAVEAELWTRRIPLVGRERELAAGLGAMLDAFRDSRASVVILDGDAGSGKTRLGEELAARARLEGAVVSHIRAVPTDRTASWSGLAGLARSGLLEAPGALRAPPEALAFALALRAACGDPVPDSVAGLATGARPSDPPQAVAGLVRAVGATRPVLLWIDGAAHLDDASAGALPSLLRDLEEVRCALLIAAGAYPPRTELDELRARLGHDLPGVALSLAPLDEAGLVGLAGHVLPDYGHEELDRVARRVHADSAGLPLLAIELLNAVRLGLELDEVGGAWPRPFHTMEQSYPGDLPDSVVAAIRVGYRRLSRPAQRLLAAASVLDERCPGDRLGSAAGVEGEDLHEALDELEWHRWLVAEPRGYAFVARIVRDVVARDMLTPGQRHRVLEAVADD